MGFFSHTRKFLPLSVNFWSTSHAKDYFRVHGLFVVLHSRLRRFRLNADGRNVTIPANLKKTVNNDLHGKAACHSFCDNENFSRLPPLFYEGFSHLSKLIRNEPCFIQTSPRPEPRTPRNITHEWRIIPAASAELSSYPPKYTRGNTTRGILAYDDAICSIFKILL